jgi:intracellular septation protein A
MPTADTVAMPPLGRLALRAVPRVVEGAVCPTVLFVALLHWLGIGAAIAGGVAWSTAVIVVRRSLGRRVPTIVLLGLGMVFVRATLALVTGSSFVYFLQPTLGTAVAGLLLLGSAVAGRPLVLRLARDFCPLPVDTMSDAHFRRFFLGLSFLWGAAQLLNASVTLWLLVSQSVGTYVIARTVMSWSLTAAVIGISVVWFTRVIRSRELHHQQRLLALSA